MIKKSVNSLSIVGFLILMLMLLLSGVALYLKHYGLSIENLYLYYAGDEANYINPKNFPSIMKTFSPHILVLPLSFFILFHIALASKSIKKEQIKYVAMFGFGSAVFDVLINFFIGLSFAIAVIKIFIFILFELSMIYVLVMIFRKIFSENTLS